MTREKLLDIAHRYTDWYRKGEARDTLAEIVAPDVKVHIPRMGLTADYAGLLAQHANTHSATKNLDIAVVQVSVDEANSTVSQVWEFKGHHTHGDWGGFPATGQPYHAFGIGVIKVDLTRGLIVEEWVVLQDLVFLQHIGAIPGPSA